MKKILLLLVPFMVFVTSCKKDTALGKNDIVQGELIIGTRSDATLKEVFAGLQEPDFKIASVSLLYYKLLLPENQVDYVINVLNQKQYINAGDGWMANKNSVRFEENGIRVLCRLNNMTPANQADLFRTMTMLNGVEQSVSRSLLLKIPVGTEEFWERETKKFPFVEWAEMNRISVVNPL